MARQDIYLKTKRSSNLNFVIICEGLLTFYTFLVKSRKDVSKVKK
jgi:hypothetical protein